MNHLRERLVSIEQKHKLFKQQQFSFISALDRSREQAQDRIEPISTVAQVHQYMINHCSNATDRRVFSLFLNIMADLEATFKLIESMTPTHSSEALDTCRKLFSANCNISNLQAHYPHDEMNHLSCNEARNYYGGVVSVIPLGLDLLKVASSELSQAIYNKPPSTPSTSKGPTKRTATSNGGKQSAGRSRKTTNTHTRSAKLEAKGRGGWHAGKPAWRPPGRRGF